MCSCHVFSCSSSCTVQTKQTDKLETCKTNANSLFQCRVRRFFILGWLGCCTGRCIKVIVKYRQGICSLVDIYVYIYIYCCSSIDAAISRSHLLRTFFWSKQLPRTAKYGTWLHVIILQLLAPQIVILVAEKYLRTHCAAFHGFQR